MALVQQREGAMRWILLYFFSRNESQGRRVFSYFWDSLDLLGRSCRNVFLQFGPPAHSNIAPTYSLLRRSYKAAIVVVNSTSPWSIIRTRSEQHNLLQLDGLDGYMLKYWWSESERAADGTESLPNANSEKKTRAYCRWTRNKCWICHCGSVKEWKDAVVAL